MRKAWSVASLVIVAFLSLLARRTHAGTLTLTSAGTSQGFTLSLFADGFPFTSSSFMDGPNGIAFPTTGGVLVTDYPGHVRVFATDANGQHVGSVPLVTFSADNAVGLASLAGTIYMTQQTNGRVVALNNDGTLNHVAVTGLPHATGIVADPLNGTLFVSTFNGGTIWQVNPVTGAIVTSFGASADGLTLSADGKVLYAADLGTDRIIGYDTTTHAAVFQSGVINGLDGTALGTGSLAGSIFANDNNGNFWKISLANPGLQTLLATGGSRGDFVTVDPSNDTILITQADTVLRLTAPSGGGFETAVPLPPAFWSGLTLLMGLAGISLLAKYRASRRQIDG